MGTYISVPFCRTKCTFCNFASGVYSRSMYASYTARISADIFKADQTAREMGGEFEGQVDSIYLGGGTPTVLAPEQLRIIFAALREKFDVHADAEVTVECAPGSLSPEMLETLVRCGVNRVSLGVQSFIDEESRSVGRLHTRAVTLDDIARFRSAGITNISVDLIAGLPHQTAETWTKSLQETIAAGVPHISVYMLEIDEDSRLGRELIAGGTKYHAHFVPDEDVTADLYLAAVEYLNASGVNQYEISNFARPGCESRHNAKYWTRQPYLGFGVDAHSMLRALSGHDKSLAVRFATPDSLDAYMGSGTFSWTGVTAQQALEEEFFLGLRMNRGVNLADVYQKYGGKPAWIDEVLSDLTDWELLAKNGDVISLTSQGRLLSNEVFERFIGMAAK